MQSGECYSVGYVQCSLGYVAVLDMLQSGLCYKSGLYSNLGSVQSGLCAVWDMLQSGLRYSLGYVKSWLRQSGLCCSLGYVTV